MSETHSFLERAWHRNPFDSDLARAHSAYAGYDGADLTRLLETAAPRPFELVAHAAFRAFVQAPEFSCLGARAALARGTYRFGAYGTLASDAATAGLARDLYAFATERHGFESTFTTFVAVFRDVAGDDDPEVSFESALWKQLQALHALDRPLHRPDPHVSSDPDDPHFSYSFAGSAFFVVGLHPGASRSARRFAWPTLVFNAHEQFEQLRDDGRFDGLQEKIRVREIELDGSLNSNVADFGTHSEARQYAGRPVDGTWRCPFRP
jgi:FPC/CPF motif-containing protein YcgG